MRTSALLKEKLSSSPSLLFPVPETREVHVTDIPGASAGRRSIHGEERGGDGAQERSTLCRASAAARCAPYSPRPCSALLNQILAPSAGVSSLFITAEGIADSVFPIFTDCFKLISWAVEFTEEVDNILWR